LRLISHIALLDNSRMYAWRGQRDASWPLSSSLFRRLEERDGSVTENSLRIEETRILAEARNWGLGRDLGLSATDMHMLAVLQHHGLPTRLFDVTANPMTALYFAIEPAPIPSDGGDAVETDGVIFAIDVTESKWHETFQHTSTVTHDQLARPLTAPWDAAIDASRSSGFFRVFSALPDERMKAQEGFFLGSAVPPSSEIDGVRGINLTAGRRPIGAARLQKLLDLENRGRGRPARVPFIAVVVPAKLKNKLRTPLKRTFNRRPRVMFPDVDGFREAFMHGRLD
jgi:hypothetical protein